MPLDDWLWKATRVSMGSGRICSQTLHQHVAWRYTNASLMQRQAYKKTYLPLLVRHGKITQLNVAAQKRWKRACCVLLFNLFVKEKAFCLQSAFTVLENNAHEHIWKCTYSTINWAAAKYFNILITIEPLPNINIIQLIVVTLIASEQLLLWQNTEQKHSQHSFSVL